MALQFDLSGSQIDGARDYQEDAFLITHLTDAEGNPSALIIVADGMGGHAAGNVASNMAVQAFNKHVNSNYPSEKPADILHECVIKANNSIKETVKETPALSGMGCTLVAAIVEQGKLWWASVGDSHLYLLRDKELIKKNADHSYGGFLDRMEAAGTPVEPEPGLARNMLMSAITGDEIDEIDISYEPEEIKPGDRVIICSDGMDTLSQGKIIQFGDWSETPKEYAEALLGAVEDAGMPKQDNTTVVIADVKEKTEAAPTVAPEAEQSPAVEEPKETTAATEESGDTTQDLATPEPAKGGKGIIFAAAAVVIIGIAIGAFVMLGGDKPATPVANEEPLTPDAPAVQEEDIAEGETTTAETGIVDETEPDKAAAPADTESTPAPTAAQEVTDEPAKATSAGDTARREFRDTLKDGTPGPTMVWIPEGSYDMGSPGSSRNTEERPRHEVHVNRFAMSKHEITFAQYDKFARATGREIPDNLYMDRETHPVIFVSWDDAYNYTRWLSEQTGETYRLASEAEWEYAAGTGKRSPFWWGYDEEPGRAHCFGCGTGLDPRKPTSVGSFDPNPFGLHDMTGNVAEWVHDCWHENYNNAPTDGSVWEGGDCSYRVVRGGAYSSPPQSIRHARRDKFKSNSRYDHIGIRVVREP